MTDNLSQCAHIESPKCELCMHCGSYLHKENGVVKSKGYEMDGAMLRGYLKSMQKRESKWRDTSNDRIKSESEHQQLEKQSQAQTEDQIAIDNQVYALLTSICDKFQFSQQTLALSLQFFHILIQNKQYSKTKLLACVCLLLAAKSIQIDKNVPYLPRFIRHAERNHTQSEYEALERSVFEHLGYYTQIPTFITYLNYYMVAGIIFKDDGLESGLVDIIEAEVRERGNEWLKRQFYSKDSGKLAASIVKIVREKFGIKGWNKQLKEMTGFEDIQKIQPKKRSFKPKEKDIKQHQHHKQLPQMKDQQHSQLHLQILQEKPSHKPQFHPSKLNELKNLNQRKKVEDKPLPSIFASLSKTTKQNSSSIPKIPNMIIHAHQKNKSVLPSLLTGAITLGMASRRV